LVTHPGNCHPGEQIKDTSRHAKLASLGRNGSGKSTLLYNIAGLLHPHQGTINVLGFNPAERTPGFLQRIFMIPEEFHLSDISIAELIRHHGRFYPHFNKEMFHHFLGVFEIPDHTLLKMSYGQKKKVLISFALACQVPLLLMDEPTNGLDIISKNQLRKVLAESVNDQTTIMISSHQVQDLTNLIDHIVILDNTKIILQRSIEEIGKKLTFRLTDDTEAADAALFKEPVLGGNQLVEMNEEGAESNVDLELLYKATMTNPNAIHYALND
jgi:ABC-2 type transport system ATP-binding protein